MVSQVPTRCRASKGCRKISATPRVLFLFVAQALHGAFGRASCGRLQSGKTAWVFRRTRAAHGKGRWSVIAMALRLN
jgi:hypothetical protein